MNPVLVTHGITGLCNLCLGKFFYDFMIFCKKKLNFILDPEVKEQLSDPLKLNYVLKLLKTDTEPNIACNCLTILIYILSPEIKSFLISQDLPEIFESYKKSSDTHLKNLSTILLEDLQKT